ncbi:SRPBCC family protein [Sinorhizobium garamanticum]|uniref:SRPBCC family protein n=1 Tax=Sinorhizobium garamanticum TaxID=680247 RepID=A0ABY8D7C2_9HYPH|nr:SRPBCC family protein [Sinorhizobium garamanticum]WEX86775.1 SRPBCC family protein [Sinorhizobium garamanticum]
MNKIEPTPVRKSVTVRASPERAFDVFVSGMGTWWIKDHSVSQSGQKTVVVEAVAGGRWYEIGKAGEECDWGRVIDCDRPNRILFAWQLNADFTFDPEFYTEVEVLFEAKGDETTVTLEHRHLGNYGAKAEEMHGMFDSERGWGASLASYAAKVA